MRCLSFLLRALFFRLTYCIVAREHYDRLGQAASDLRAKLKAADERVAKDGGSWTAEETAAIEAANDAVDAAQANVDAQEKADKIRGAVDRTEAFLGESRGRASNAGTSSRREETNTSANAPLSINHGAASPLVIEPGTPAHARGQESYRKNFVNYLLTGVTAGLQTASDPKGGYVTSTQMASSIIMFMNNLLWLRQIANVLPPIPNSVSLGIPTYDADPGDADWTAEVPASALSEDDTITLGKRELTPHLVTKYLKVSQKLLRTSVIGIESLIRERLAYKFGVTEEKGFMTGTGIRQPLGVFVASSDGISTGRDVTAAATTAVVGDDLLGCFYNLKPQYQQRASWIINRTLARDIRKLKDGQGQYIWQPGLTGDQPQMILGRPVYQSEYAPNTMTTGQYVAVCGDFKAGYWVVDSLELEVQRLNELLALTNQVGFVARKETDAMPVLEEAFSRLKLA